MSVSSAHSHLSTLYQAEYLVKETGEYRLSYEFLMIGAYVRNSSDLFRFGRGEADALADQTGHYVHLFTEEKGLGVNIYEARGDLADEYDYQSLKLQRRESLHVTASGKTILASLDERDRREHHRPTRTGTVHGEHDHRQDGALRGVRQDLRTWVRAQRT